MTSFQKQGQSIVLWILAIVGIVLLTIFYQPAAAKTGSLLIWMNEHVYIMDIDSLIVEPVAPAPAQAEITPSPGCYGPMASGQQRPCWVAVEQNLYRVARNATAEVAPRPLVADPTRWIDSQLSWSPDGVHLAYAVLNADKSEIELQLYNATTAATQTIATAVDPTLPVAWSAACAAGLGADCWLAYKTVVTQAERPALLRAVTPMGQQTKQWELPAGEPIAQLRWRYDGELLYSQPKRYFYEASTQQPAFSMMPAAAELANLSPEGRYVVYYQPFTLRDCQSQPEDAESCLYLGVWIAEHQPADGAGGDENSPQLIYSLRVAETATSELNFVPTWAPHGQRMVFFQAGNLIHFDVESREATIWQKSLRGKLRSVPVFSPDEAAVAFVDNQGRGLSEYRLQVINPRLQPIEHVIDTETGFRVLAWLSD